MHTANIKHTLNDRLTEKRVLELACEGYFKRGREYFADVSALEREIDRLVYKLYELTPEEIKIIGNQIEHTC